MMTMHVLIQLKPKIQKQKWLGRRAMLASCHVGLPPPQGLGRLAIVASCHVGLPSPEGLGRLAAAGLVPGLACRRPRVRQACHAGLVPRRHAAAHSNVQCLCSKHGFSNPTKQGEMLSFCSIVFFNIFTNATPNKTVLHSTTHVLNRAKQG